MLAVLRSLFPTSTHRQIGAWLCVHDLQELWAGIRDGAITIRQVAP